MANSLGCFGRRQKIREKSPQKDRTKNSRILLGDLKRCKPHSRCLFELALPENASKSILFFPPFEVPSVVPSEMQTFPQWKIQKDFKKLHFRERKRMKNKRIYILPIGPFPAFVLEKISCFESSFFELLCKFVSNFYLGFEVELLDVVDLSEIHCKTRIHEGIGTVQVLVEDVLSYLRKTLPKDGYSVVGITWEDLYPGDDWNFILGEASSDGYAALSFGHHEPKGAQKVYSGNENIDADTKKKSRQVNTGIDLNSYKESCKDITDNNVEPGSEVNTKFYAPQNVDINITDNKVESGSGVNTKIYAPQNVDINSQASNKLDMAVGGSIKDSIVLVTVDKKANELAGRIDRVDAFQLWKFFRVVSHELGHVFGITHCIYFACAMNESSSVQEAINQPLFMCPVCFKKIQAATGFDVKERYHSLKRFLQMVYKCLLQQDRGKVDRYELLDGSSDIEVEDNFNLKDLERFSGAVQWIDSILEFLDSTEPE